MFPYLFGFRVRTGSSLFSSCRMNIDPRRKFTTEDPYVKPHIKVGIQGVCLELGQKKIGAAKGPEKLRNTGFIRVLRDVVQADVCDYGDVNLQRYYRGRPEKMFLTNKDKKSTFPTNTEGLSRPHQTHRLWEKLVPCRNIKEVGAANQAIFESTQRIMRDGRICLTLGGDHSLSIGTLAGSSRVHRNLGVIWIDAHSDINTPFTSHSGNMHGMVLGFHLREMAPYMPNYPEFDFISPWLGTKDIVYIGLRDVEPYEKYFLQKFGIKGFSMKDIDRIGVNAVIEQTLDHLFPSGARPIHISLDVDAIDPHDIPSTGTPVPGGLTLREGMHMLEEFQNTGEMVALDVVELNPLVATEFHANRSAQATEELICACFQYHRGGMPSETEPMMPLPEKEEVPEPKPGPTVKCT